MSRSVYRRDGGWRLRWGIVVAGDVLAACLAYLLAFALRTRVPLPLTQGYLPSFRFAEVNHHWIEMIVTQVELASSGKRAAGQSKLGMFPSPPQTPPGGVAPAPGASWARLNHRGAAAVTAKEKAL